MIIKHSLVKVTSKKAFAIECLVCHTVIYGTNCCSCGTCAIRGTEVVADREYFLKGSYNLLNDKFIKERKKCKK